MTALLEREEEGVTEQNGVRGKLRPGNEAVMQKEAAAWSWRERDHRQRRGRCGAGGVTAAYDKLGGRGAREG